MSNKTQTEKQRASKSPLYGYRKPHYDGYHWWCSCTIPTLMSTMGIGPGQAYCCRCGYNYYK